MTEIEFASDVVDIVGVVGWTFGTETGAKSSTHTVNSKSLRADWDHEPTQSEIDAVNSDLGAVSYVEWLATHGGDMILTTKRKAKEALDEQQDFLLTVDRAILELTRKYVNEARTSINTIGVAYVQLTNYLDGLAGVTIPDNAKLTGLQQLVNKTEQEAIDAVKDEVTNA